jgi:hypothetical protein
MDFGCAAYCQFAEQCLGALPDDIKEKQQDLIKDKVGMEVRRLLLQQPKLMQKAQNAARYAERLGKDVGGDMGAVIMAAHLLYVQQADTANGQGMDFQQTPRDILDKAGAKPDVADKVESVLDQLSKPWSDPDLEVRIVRDAATLAGLEEESKAQSLSREDIEGRITQGLSTPEAQDLARRILLG